MPHEIITRRAGDAAERDAALSADAILLHRRIRLRSVLRLMMTAEPSNSRQRR